MMTMIASDIGPDDDNDDVVGDENGAADSDGPLTDISVPPSKTYDRELMRTTISLYSRMAPGAQRDPK